jgi:hypothetical protein
MPKPITMLDLCKIYPEKAAERIEALVKRNADIERSLNIANCMIDSLRSVKAEMEGERYLKDNLIAELEKELNLTKDIIVAHQIADETGYIDGVGWVENWSEMEDKVSNLLEAHNLDQQAKGAGYVYEEIEVYSSATDMRGAAQRVTSSLRNQVKALRGQP